MLEGDNVILCPVQKCSACRIVTEHFFFDLEAYGGRIRIIAARVGYGDDAGLQIWACQRDGPMQIMGERGDSAAAGKVIADECDPLERTH